MARSSEPEPSTDAGTDGAQVAVVGVGNPIMGDDGLGERIVEELEGLPETDTGDVTLTHAGTTAFFALEAMSGSETAVVIDAIATGEEPGTVQRYRWVDGSFAGEVPEMTMHDFSFAEALHAGREAYDLPDELLIFGVEPARVEASMELSEPVEAAVPELVELVLDRLPE
ncbi:MAG: hydrogenase maturation protease [Haloferacaceae archaeon]